MLPTTVAPRKSATRAWSASSTTSFEGGSCFTSSGNPGFFRVKRMPFWLASPCRVSLPPSPLCSSRNETNRPPGFDS